MLKVTSVVTSHGDERQLRSALGYQMYQAKPDETIVFCSGVDDLMRLREDFPDVVFHETLVPA